jgi:Phage holin T7 family, holin superfamily II
MRPRGRVSDYLSAVDMIDHQTVNDGVKLVPSAAVGGLMLFGVHLSDIVVALTGIYTLLMIGDFVWRKWIKRH